MSQELSELLLQLLGFSLFCFLAFLFLRNKDESLNEDKAKRGNRKLPAGKSTNDFNSSMLNGGKLVALKYDIPGLQEINYTGSIPSFTSLSQSYELDLFSQSCSCPKFASQQHFQKNDVRRWCKHLIEAMDQHGAFAKLDQSYHVPIMNALGSISEIYQYQHPEMKAVYFVVGHNEDWLNVIVRRTKQGEKTVQASGHYRRYGWSYSQKRWSNGDAPKGASNLRRTLKYIASPDDLRRFCEIE